MMNGGGDDNPLEELFQKIKRQWNVPLPDCAPAVAIEGKHGHRRGDDTSEECFVLLVQHSLGSNLRILSSGGSGTGDLAARRHGDTSSDGIRGNARKTNAASSDAKDVTTPTLYERAGVRSPPERAWRDLHGSSAWLENIFQSLGKASDVVLWVQTLPVRDRRRIPSLHNVETMNLSRDPFGWNAQGEGESPGNEPNLENLDRVLQVIKDRVQEVSMTSSEHRKDSRTTSPPRPPRGFVPVVLQSVTPIVHRHGFARTLQFLKELQRCCPVLVVPTNIEALSRDQHWSLEGMASAVLAVEDGVAVMLRRGIREITNVVREALELDFADFGGTTSASTSTRTFIPRVRRVSPSSGVASTAERPETTKEETLGATTSPALPTGKPKIQLSISDEDAPRAAASWRSVRTSNEPSESAVQEERNQPNIIVQDDDPEFDDYDEEDPDDDLDL